MSRFHIAGIGGVGMSALAQALLDAGHSLSGSDRQLDGGDDGGVFRILRGQGVELVAQDGAGIVPGLDGLIVSSAIEESNAEVVRARKLGIRLVHRAEALAELAKGFDLVAVSGTSGKSSVTALLGWLLTEAGFDPCVVNGAGIVGWEADGTRIASVRKGRQWLVAEVDESDKSLLCFEPAHALITNVSADHFGLEESNALFDVFEAKVRGIVIDGRDGAVPEGMSATGMVGRFTFEGLEFTVPLPGLHNVMNAWNAVRMARALGADTETLQKALATFRGVHRRLERVGACDGAAIFDDYAHNVEKLRAALGTLQEAFPRGVAAIWRPHGYGPLRKMCQGLAKMFAEQVRAVDRLLILPVFDAGGAADRSIGSDDLARAMEALGARYPLLPESMNEAETLLHQLAPSMGCIVFLGARDPDLPRAARRLAQA